MNNKSENHKNNSSGSATSGIFAGWIKLLTSLRFTIVILVIIAVACVLGTLIPQGSNVIKYLAKNPDAEQKMAVLRLLGLTHIFSSYWFTALLCLLFLSLSICSFRRFRAFKKFSGRVHGGRTIGSMLTHISLLFILAGATIRGVWGEKGYIEFEEGEVKTGFQTEKGYEHLPFSLCLEDFEIEMYDLPQAGIAFEKLIIKGENQVSSFPVEMGKEHVFKHNGQEVLVRIVNRVLDFQIDAETKEVTSRSDEPRNPAIQVEVIGADINMKRWLFAKFPDFGMNSDEKHSSQGNKIDMIYAAEQMVPTQPQVKDFKSKLKIIEEDKVVKKKTIEVNSPLSYKGYTFYQSGYNPKRPSWTSIEVVRDPGVPVVYAGFVLMILGLTVVVCVYPGARSDAEHGKTGQGDGS